MPVDQISAAPSESASLAVAHAAEDAEAVAAEAVAAMPVVVAEEVAAEVASNAVVAE